MVNFASNSASCSGVSSNGTAPEEMVTNVSDVLVSESTEMQLKVLSGTRGTMSRRAAREMATAVVMNTSIVAMLGSTMPAPLATPTMRPPPMSSLRSFGNVSGTSNPKNKKRDRERGRRQQQSQQNETNKQAK